MNTKSRCHSVLVGFLILLLAAPPPSLGQSSGSPSAFKQEELDQMLAPIALYPDSLLAQILMAAAYPLEVVQADRWVKQNKNLKGEQLNAALDKMTWDLSVKALVPFPQVLSMMSEQLDWTSRLGEAFLAQQADVMNTVQKLRAKAKEQGNLKTTKEQKVVVQDQTIVIEPANPTVVYVPTYNPTVVYGSWWYPSYPPYPYYPYYPAGGVVAAGVIGFAAGVAVGAAWNNGWGRWNWGSGDVNVNANRNVNINRNQISQHNTRNWQAEASHRKGVAYQNDLNRQRYGQSGSGLADSRRDYRGFSGDAGGRGSGNLGGRPGAGAGTGNLGGRPGAGPGTGDPGSRPGAGAGIGGGRLSDQPGQRPATRPAGDSARGSIQQRPSAGAFDGMGSSRQTRMDADRGRSSRDMSSSGFRGQGSGGGRGGGSLGGASRGGGGFQGGGGGGGRGGGGGGRGGGGGGRGGRR